LTNTSVLSPSGGIVSARRVDHPWLTDHQCIAKIFCFIKIDIKIFNAIRVHRSDGRALLA